MQKAFFLSTLWHLFWMSSITIVSLPQPLQYPRFSGISFLGALLDEPSFEVHVTQKPFLHTQAALPQRGIGRAGLYEFPGRTPDLLKADFHFSEKAWDISTEFLGFKKKNPLVLSRKEELEKTEAPLLEGPAALRVLYYQPQIPELPKWIDPREVRSSLELRFWISPRGKVVSVEKFTSTGDPTLDLIGMRHLRRWQFNPKPTDREEWGTVTLHFSLPQAE